MSSVTRLTQTAALRTMIDNVQSMYPLCCVIATSTAAVNALDPGVVLEHRLGGYKVALQSLDTAERAALLSRLMKGFELEIDCEIAPIGDTGGTRDAALRDVASRCQVRALYPTPCTSLFVWRSLVGVL